METLRQPSAVLPGDEEEFGWQLVHDRLRNLVFYLHSYTGEVRWLPPRKVGFVMRGLHPLPAASDGGDDWSPYFPHVVATPSGLMPVHVDESDATHQSCGPFNRFPLVGLGVTASGQRLLPPTWEDFGASPPFLPPYPVAVLPSIPPTSPELEELTPMAPLPTLIPTHLGQVETSLVYDGVHTYAGPVVHQRQYPIGTRPADARGTKEHNRKGYILRQTRKLMKELGVSATSNGHLSAAVHPVAASPDCSSSDPTAPAVDPHKQRTCSDAIYTSPSVC